MKNQITNIASSALLFVLTMFFTVAAYAQDGGLDIDVSIGKEEWYQKPWVWVVGGAVFILILVGLLRKKR